MRLIVSEKWFSHQSKVASFSKSALRRMLYYFHKQRFSCFDLIVTGRRIETLHLIIFLMKKKKGRHLRCRASQPQGESGLIERMKSTVTFTSVKGEKHGVGGSVRSTA